MKVTTKQSFTAVVEKDTITGLYVGYIPGVVGAHTQAESLEELQLNLREVLSLVLADDTSAGVESEFVGTQLVTV